ncbi:uncharacterized protein A1O9_00233 [Exophiala aquamarina CBS 119918]|uniref:Uncharacterized protein n=1 Tax=Exophiala aquamarina CBS 119918 TaxID=1182545 RepID=A0A072PR05_9EURO|nr:uncharacterized protein A1O9_00233 [Exophiala aquamarina CBS 119918]KEF62261.1 hypothetical protein A1O9_00233 [Exophiala aquamarina CBS 119918]
MQHRRQRTSFYDHIVVREWKYRLGEAGAVFCSEACQKQWDGDCGLIGIAAHSAVESATKQQLRRRGNGQAATVGLSDDSENGTQRPPTTEEDIISVWKAAGLVGKQIVAARTTTKPSKSDRRILRTAEEGSADHDVLAYILSAVLSADKRSAARGTAADDGKDGKDDDEQQLAPPAIPGAHMVLKLFPDLMTLADDRMVYASNSSLPGYINAYHHLLAILPTPLLKFLRPALCHEIASRASHNAFSIRPAGNSDGEQSGEFLGRGIWPEASFFNHSCRPNVKKERIGRVWVFTAAAAAASGEEMGGESVGEGEELCITYLGGDERDLDVRARRKKLRDEWGFDCRCRRCEEELRELAQSGKV